MKTKNLWKYALSGLLLASMPLCALAQTAGVTVPNQVNVTQPTVIGFGGNAVNAGVDIWVNGVNAGLVGYTDAGGTPQTQAFAAGVGTIQLQGVNVPNVNDAAPFPAWGTFGVVIDNVGNNSLSQKTINTGDINLAGTAVQSLGGFSYFTNAQAFDGTLEIGNVSVRNNRAVWGDPAIGVTFETVAGGAANIAGNVQVGNVRVQGLGAIGFNAFNLQGGANVSVGNVDITGNAGGNGIVAGVSIGNVGDGVPGATESFTVGNVNVTSATGLGGAPSVYGIWAGNVGADGIFRAGNVNVRSTATNVATPATGVRVAGVVAPANNFRLGEVRVESANNATGIDLQGGSTITITNDVIARTNAATDANTRAFGIVANAGGVAQNITINTTEGDVQISGIATNPTGNILTRNVGESINLWAGNNDTLTITGANMHSNRGQEFDVVNVENVRWATDAEYNPVSSFVSNNATRHQVATGNTAIVHGFVAVNGGNTYTVGSAADNQNAGTLVLHNLTAGNVTVNNGLLALDGSTRSAIGTLTIGNNNAAAQAPAAVALYGNTQAGNIGLAVNGAPTVLGNAVVDPTTGERVLSLSTITEYTLNAGRTAYVANNRRRASLADGFLLPASIHRYNTGWEATRDHLISGGQRVKSGKGILGQAPCDPCEPVCDACEPVCDACEPVCEPCEPTCDDVVCNPCDPCGSKGLSIGRSVWVNYIGRSNSYQSSYTNIGIANGDWEIGTDGVQVGLDLFKTTKAQLGLLFGYEGSKATLRSDRLDADDVYFGAYAARVLSNGADFRAVYNYGSQDYKLTRLDPGLGFDWHSHNSAFDGNTHEVNLELGKRFFANRRWSYRPVIGFDLLVNNWDAAQEDGNLATAIAYNDADYTQAFLRIGSDLKFVKGGFVFNSGLYYSYDLNGDELKTKVFARDGSALGYDRAINSTLYGSKLGRSVLTFNVGGSLALSSRTSVFGGFTGDNSFDRDGDKFQSNGYVGLQYQW